jgi:hypothetical protein
MLLAGPKRIQERLCVIPGYANKDPFRVLGHFFCPACFYMRKQYRKYFFFICFINLAKLGQNGNTVINSYDAAVAKNR